MTKPTVQIHRITARALTEALRKVPASGKPSLEIVPKDKPSKT